MHIIIKPPSICIDLKEIEDRLGAGFNYEQ